MQELKKELKESKEYIDSDKKDKDKVRKNLINYITKNKNIYKKSK